MRYYEGHEKVYQDLRGKGCRAWDEFLGQAADFDSFCMKKFMAEMLSRSAFTREHPLALEIGCGTGPACCFLAGNGFRVEGMDISATAIDIAREQAEERGLDITYSVGDICQGDLQHKKYDLIVDGHCMHCIVTEKDRRKALGNIRAAIRTGGQFWMDTMLADGATNFGKNTLLDANGILWVKIPAPGRFDLEKQVDGMTYVANRRVYYDSGRLESELHEAGLVITWSNTVAPAREEMCAAYQAICTVN